MDRGETQIAKSQARFPAMWVLLRVAWFSDYCGTMSWGQVADDRTKNGMVKISAVVGKHALREDDAVDSTEAQFSLKVRKDLPRRRERSHPCAR